MDKAERGSRLGSMQHGATLKLAAIIRTASHTNATGLKAFKCVMNGEIALLPFIVTWGQNPVLSIASTGSTTAKVMNRPIADGRLRKNRLGTALSLFGWR